MYESLLHETGLLCTSKARWLITCLIWLVLLFLFKRVAHEFPAEESPTFENGYCMCWHLDLLGLVPQTGHRWEKPCYFSIRRGAGGTRLTDSYVFCLQWLQITWGRHSKSFQLIMTGVFPPRYSRTKHDSILDGSTQIFRFDTESDI